MSASTTWSLSRSLEEPLSILALAGPFPGAFRYSVAAETERGKTEHVDPASLAFVSSMTGDDDITFYWLERAYADRIPLLVHLAGWPSFDPLHSDPRFKDLLRRIGFPQSQRVSA